MTAFILALRVMASRAAFSWTLPTRFDSQIKNGTTTSDANVNFHDSVSIAASVTTTESTLLTALRNTNVNADCAPTTSLFRRLMSEPVWVRVKNAIGMRCT